MLKENLLDVKQKKLKSALSTGKGHLWIETGLESDEEKLQRLKEKEQREKKILYMYRGAAAFIGELELRYQCMSVIFWVRMSLCSMFHEN